MRKYRVITNGEKFKAQIRDTFLKIPHWATLQKNYNDYKIPLIMRDIVYGSYQEAEKAAKAYVEKLEKDKKWWPIN